jgi:hypothetical protein
MKRLSKKAQRRKSEKTITTCCRRNDALLALYYWTLAKRMRRGVRAAEDRLFAAARAYHERGSIT